jgi:hypothetical protein
MNKKEAFFKNLSKEKMEKLQSHFTLIFNKKAEDLDADARSIVYLAWLWKNGLVTKGENGFYAFDEDEAGVSLSDYEDIYFAETIFMPGSYNLESLYIQYNLERIMAIL